MTHPIVAREAAHAPLLKVQTESNKSVHTSTPDVSPSPVKPGADRVDISRAARHQAATTTAATEVTGIQRSVAGSENGQGVASSLAATSRRVLDGLRAAFHTVKSDKQYNAGMDFNRDGKINIRDMAIARSKLEKVTSQTMSTVANDQTVPDNPKAMLAALRDAFFAREGDEHFNAALDFNQDGIINVSDLGLARARLAADSPQPVPPTVEAASGIYDGQAGAPVPPDVTVIDDQTVPDNPKAMLAALRDAFFAREGDEHFNAALDFNQDGIINVSDLGLARGRLAADSPQPVPPTVEAASGTYNGQAGAPVPPDVTVIDDQTVPDNPKAMLAALRDAFFAREGDQHFNGALDFNQDGIINVRDLGLARARLAADSPQPVPPTVEAASGIYDGQAGAPVPPDVTVIDDQTVPDNPKAMLAALRDAFFAREGDEHFNGALDFNQDGIINVRDLGLARARLAADSPQPVPPTVEAASDAIAPKRVLEMLRAAYTQG